MTWALALAGYTLAAFGLAFVLGFSKVLDPLRRWLLPEEDSVSIVARHHHLTRDELVAMDPVRITVLTQATLAARPSLSGDVLFAAARGWLYALVTCPPCVGFWTGLFAGAAAGAFSLEWVHLRPWAWIPACAVGLALFTCSSNLILGRLVGLIPDPNAVPPTP